MRASSLGIGLSHVRPHMRKPVEPVSETTIEYPDQNVAPRPSLLTLVASGLVVFVASIVDVCYIAVVATAG